MPQTTPQIAPEPTPDTVIQTDQIRRLLDKLNQQQQPAETLTGWPGLAKSIMSAPLDKLLAIAVACGLGYVIYKGPIILGEIAAANQRTFQEERERDRQFNASQTKQLSDAMAKLSTDIIRLEQTNNKLEQSFTQFRNRPTGTPPFPEQDPCDSFPWWDRLRDGTPADRHAPINGRGTLPTITDDSRHCTGDGQWLRVVGGRRSIEHNGRRLTGLDRVRYAIA